MAFTGNREAGLTGLAEFVPRAGRWYAAERNLDRGPEDRYNVSTLSPWVRHRLVTEREVVEAVLQQHSLDAAGKFVQEVYWPTYWKGWLELPWHLGAYFFMRHLLDGDPASNTLSWRWVAGLQTVGKTYLATTQNIEFATEGRFRPRGLATQAVALDDDGPPVAPGFAPQPEPLPTGRAALLLHEDDLHAESVAPTLAAAGADVVAVARTTRRRLPCSTGSPHPRFCRGFRRTT